MENLKILTIGSWKEAEAKRYQNEAEELGKLIAERGHTLVAAPGGGVYGAVGISFKKHGGKHSIGYYPSDEAKDTVGEEYAFEPDEKVHTGKDYPTRSLFQLQGADAVIAIAGGLGTPVEFILAASDYKLPSAYLRGSSSNMDKVVEFDGIKGKSNVFAGNTVESLVDFVEQYKA